MFRHLAILIILAIIAILAITAPFWAKIGNVLSKGGKKIHDQWEKDEKGDN